MSTHSIDATGRIESGKAPTDDESRPPTEPGRAIAQNTVRNVPMHNYEPSPDGHHVAAVDLERGALRVLDPQGEELAAFHGQRPFYMKWSPDGRGIAFLVSGTTNPLRPDEPAPELPPDAGKDGDWSHLVHAQEVRYADLETGKEWRIAGPQAGRMGNFEWSPAGNAIYWAEIEEFPDAPPWYHLQRCSFPGGKVETLVTTFDLMSFYNPPVSVSEMAGRVLTGTYPIMYGTTEGLFIVYSDGSREKKVWGRSQLNAQNMEWSPTMDRFVVFIATPPPEGDPEDRGLYFLKVEEGKAADVRLLHPVNKGEVHTIWWSPSGKYLTVATMDGVYIYGREGEMIHSEPIAGVTGFRWSSDESRLAITTGRRVYVWEQRSKKLYRVLLMMEEDIHFLADPNFVGDRLFYTIYRNLGESMIATPPPGSPTVPGTGGGR